MNENQRKNLIYRSTGLSVAAANIMQTPGAFAWWYLDLVTPGGDALVFLWSFGLPFLPSHQGHPAPGARPALSVALYQGERATFYLLQELDAADAAILDAGRWRFGDTSIALTRDGDASELCVELALPIPASGSRLVGTIRARGPRWSWSGDLAEPPAGAHVWSPIFAGAHGVADLRQQGGDRFVLAGRAYLDGNASGLPLDALGIRAWRWGRVTLGARDLVYYALSPADGGPDVELASVVEGGVVRPLDDARFEWQEPARSLMGVRHERALRLVANGVDARVRVRALVDDGPFYLRALTRAGCAATGASGVGLAETVVPGRVGVPWQQPFVRMRRHHVGGSNSLWLPLFSGPRRGRVRRLVSQLLPGAGRS
jgi:hypothetical protein